MGEDKPAELSKNCKSSHAEGLEMWVRSVLCCFVYFTLILILITKTLDLN